ncbi:hypothetical protein QZH41_006535 [Actinostola sp. cb2023]|nr:hypothetical protein QZH41_006535 [Actinostola sp. cb2023]
MPLKKATIFKRFNVGGYMKLKRKESEAIAQKKIELGRKAAQFKRLDNKVPTTTPFYRYVDVLRSKCNLSRLAKKVIRWFNETKGNGKHFDYRFTESIEKNCCNEQREAQLFRPCSSVVYPDCRGVSTCELVGKFQIVAAQYDGRVIEVKTAVEERCGIRGSMSTKAS